MKNRLSQIRVSTILLVASVAVVGEAHAGFGFGRSHDTRDTAGEAGVTWLLPKGGGPGRFVEATGLGIRKMATYEHREGFRGRTKVTTTYQVPEGESPRSDGIDVRAQVVEKEGFLGRRSLRRTVERPHSRTTERPEGRRETLQVVVKGVWRPKVFARSDYRRQWGPGDASAPEPIVLETPKGTARAWALPGGGVGHEFIPSQPRRRSRRAERAPE